MDGTFLPEADWHYLLGEIHNHQVIPIVGPEMVTVREPSTGISIPLYRALAPKLAAALAVPTNGAPATSLNRVACDYLLSGGARKAIYGEVAELLERMELTPPCCTLRAGVYYRFRYLHLGHHRSTVRRRPGRCAFRLSTPRTCASV